VERVVDRMVRRQIAAKLEVFVLFRRGELANLDEIRDHAPAYRRAV
jgi:hypothetical protein